MVIVFPVMPCSFSPTKQATITITELNPKGVGQYRRNVRLKTPGVVGQHCRNASRKNFKVIYRDFISGKLELAWIDQAVIDNSKDFP
jgi:hypothetical protein